MDRKKLESLFGRYRDPSEPDKIGMEGVVKFLDDLQLDPSSRLVMLSLPSLYISLFSLSRTVLIIAWKFKAQQQCEFSKEEFTGGMTELGEAYSRPK